MSEESAGDNCAAGSKKIESGLDLDADGVLGDAEVTAVTYLCS